MADQPNPFVSRLIERSKFLAVRAEVAIEEARHLRMYRRRLRTQHTPTPVDELTAAKLRRALLTPE